MLVRYFDLGGTLWCYTIVDRSGDMVVAGWWFGIGGRLRCYTIMLRCYTILVILLSVIRLLYDCCTIVIRLFAAKYNL